MEGFSMLNANWLMIGAGAVVMVVAGAVAVAATDWGGSGTREATALTSTTSDGAKPRRSRSSRGRGSSLLTLIQFDSDSDGKITRSEVESGITAQFQAIDTSHDGRIDGAEFKVYDAARRAERKARRAAWLARTGGSDEQPAVDRAPFEPMKRLDWNLDGFVTPDEWGGRYRALAMRADKDGDGTILVEELKNPPQRSRRRSS
jgi:hypothetical protein